MKPNALLLCALVLALSAPAAAQNVDVKVHTLENGLKVLMVPRPGDPNITAGCSMADMAPMDDVEDAWDDLEQVLGPDGIVPVTYMNSIAGIKALCGRNGGAVCTSSNAAAVLELSLIHI